MAPLVTATINTHYSNSPGSCGRLGPYWRGGVIEIVMLLNTPFSAPVQITQSFNNTRELPSTTRPSSSNAS
ncbi:hypothetical protein E2C01_076434 [Portunus trituberculatus]|uniref:Uncharacterized protein n=1 Tax=Portunus trituberculatus TaxID=210409 RepID=A0A5B7IBJ0_PORTR|nr:hypothetical protein [Portunus trituberculatus]